MSRAGPDHGRSTARRWRLAAAALLLVFIPPPSAIGEESSSSSAAQDDPSRDKYAVASRLAAQGKTEGYRRLIAMATDDQSAEWSEAANERILRLLHKDTQSWLRAMAPLDDTSLRQFLPWCVGIWPMLESMPEEYGSLPTFRRDVLARLRQAKGSPRELALARFMIDLLMAQPDGPSDRPTTP